MWSIEVENGGDENGMTWLHMVAMGAGTNCLAGTSTCPEQRTCCCHLFNSHLRIHQGHTFLWFWDCFFFVDFLKQPSKTEKYTITEIEVSKFWLSTIRFHRWKGFSRRGTYVSICWCLAYRRSDKQVVGSFIECRVMKKNSGIIKKRI